MKEAFVTGGSGFVGRHLIPALCARGIGVRALARSAEAARAVEQLGASAVSGDLNDRDALERGMRGADVVFHAAAHVKQQGSRATFFEANVGGTHNVLDAAKAAGVRRFVHVGTEAVLADGKPIIRADETRPRASHPAGLYPLTKGLAEAAVLAANAPDFAAIVIRPRLIWGAGDTTLLPDIVTAVKKGRFAWIDGGHYLTSTCHVDNVVEGALLAAEKGRGGEIYFLTDGEPVEFRAFLGQLLRAQGVEPGEKEVPRWLLGLLAGLTSWMNAPPITKTALALAGHEVTVVDAKARRELGYRAAVSLEAGLSEMRAGLSG
jgi:nucleoside-diphosphate-sugar epimerase